MTLSTLRSRAVYHLRIPLFSPLALCPLNGSRGLIVYNPKSVHFRIAFPHLRHKFSIIFTRAPTSALSDHFLPILEMIYWRRS